MRIERDHNNKKKNQLLFVDEIIIQLVDKPCPVADFKADSYKFRSRPTGPIRLEINLKELLLVDRS